MKKRFARARMSVHVIGAIVLLLIVFGIIISTIGYLSFSRSFLDGYAVSTYHMADTAATLINGDHLDEYLNREEVDEYERTRMYLSRFVHRMSVSIIYVIVVDQSDYGSFVSVFNAIDNSVDDTTYVEWPLGHERETTNDEYRQKYIELYENGSDYETVFRTRNLDGYHPHVTTMVPIRNLHGDVAALLCVQRPMNELTAARRPYLVNIACSTAALAVAASVLASIYIRKRILQPLTKVSDEA
ncbi:MAG: hypothetical protein IJU67_06270, partial [Lachnospiraceae bacterium]|nr:hypothetical protein [Lachnospiraceae bacterium]